MFILFSTLCYVTVHRRHSQPSPVCLPLRRAPIKTAAGKGSPQGFISSFGLEQALALAFLAQGQVFFLPSNGLTGTPGTHPDQVPMIFNDLREVVDEVALAGSPGRSFNWLPWITMRGGLQPPAWAYQLDPATVHHGRLVIFLGHLHDAGQHGGAGAAGRGLVSLVDGFEQVTDATAVQGGDEVHPGEVDEAPGVCPASF